MSPATQDLYVITVSPNIYPSDGRRLFFPDHHVSIMIPRRCTEFTVASNCFQIEHKESPIKAVLMMQKSGRLTKKWLDDDIVERSETLRPTAEAQVVDGVISRELASPSYRGCRLRVDDAWGNGVSATFRGPAKDNARMRTMMGRLFDSVRFIQREPLSEAQAVPAITDYVNAKAANNGDLALYIDRHFYMVRDEVIEAFRAFSKQAQREGHFAADVATARFEFLLNARAAIDRGSWDLSMADLRKARYSILQRSGQR
jgi:hypothetical protein